MRNKENFFFTADLHLSHANILKYCGRDFKDTHHMNKTITEAWNDTVGKHDWIALLGDLTMDIKKIPMYLQKLNGYKIYVPGNHDSRAEKIIRKHKKETGNKLVERISPLISKKIGEQVIILCHYAMRVWDRSHHGAIQLYGHSHGGLPPEGRQMDIGVDNAFKLLGEYRPFSFTEVIQFIPKHQPKNHHGR